MSTLYGLPDEVVFCRRCVMSNQRPRTVVEHGNAGQGKGGLHFDADGVCDACRYAEQKDRIDWEARERELVSLLDRHRRPGGDYEVLVPGSGGKDSAFAAHILKHHYGMRALTCTWPPHIYTDVGWRNFRAWIDVGGFDNLTFNPSGDVHRLLTRLAFQNLLHPFQPFILGQKILAPRLAALHGISLVFYGENEAEYGNAIVENATPSMDRGRFTRGNMVDLRLSGLSLAQLHDAHGLSAGDLAPYIPPRLEEVAEVDVRYLGYYLRWNPQECYYYAVEHTGFDAAPLRSEGTYSKYHSLDDKLDGLHHYTSFIKFGLGRASMDAARDIRNRHILREEGVALVQKFDGEFPARDFGEVLEYMGISEDQFRDRIDEGRPSHLWDRNTNGTWRLRHHVV